MASAFNAAMREDDLSEASAEENQLPLVPPEKTAAFLLCNEAKQSAYLLGSYIKYISFLTYLQDENMLNFYLITMICVAIIKHRD
jgi:hypothetical protein